MAETQAKYHHLIPQTYMNAWAHGKGTLYVEFLNNLGKIEKRNKERIAGITDFHSITAGMPICTQTDADTIFAPVLCFNIEYDGQTITSSLELNKKYPDFDNWIITRNDGTTVSKKSIRRDIEKIKIKDIEANWCLKYENDWSDEVEKIKSETLKKPNGCIPSFDVEYLMKLFTALDWRGFCSNQQFEETYKMLISGTLDEIDIPDTERVLPSLKTAADEMRHYLLLQYYRKYLNDEGIIYQDAMANLKYTNFHFLISDGLTTFITSDSPAFIHKGDDGKLIGILPITPRILMVKGKCSSTDHGIYYVSHITDDAVKRYNGIIKDKAEEFTIT